MTDPGKDTFRPLEILFKIPVDKEKLHGSSQIEYELTDGYIKLTKYTNISIFSIFVTYRNQKYQVAFNVSSEISLIYLGYTLVFNQYFEFNTIEQTFNFLGSINILDITNTLLSLNYHKDKNGNISVLPEQYHLITEITNELQLQSGLAFV